MDIEIRLQALVKIPQELKFWSFYQGWYQTGLLDTENDKIYIFTIESNNSSKLLSGSLDLQDVTKQCTEQGIESKESIIRIWERIKESILQTTLNSFEVSDWQIKISFSITKVMKVFFNVPYIELQNGAIVSQILGSLVKYVIFITNLCLIERRGLLKVIDEKDKAIDYLAFLVKDLGGKQILERNDPIGSMGNSTIDKFNSEGLRNHIFNEISTDVIPNTEPLDIFNIGKQYINCSRSSSCDSPVITLDHETNNSSQSIKSKSQIKPLSSQNDIMRFGRIGNNNKRLSTADDDTESSPALSSSNSRSSSISPKKRKFGKISTNTKK